jgi:hypothetical protein
MLLIGETSAPPPSGAFFWGTIANEPRQGSGLTTFRAWVRPSPQNYELVACPCLHSRREIRTVGRLPKFEVILLV